MRIKQPKLALKTGEQARILRRQLGMSQSAFWSRISVTQSGGSRYESAGDMPKHVQYLLQIAFGTEKQFTELVNWLQRPEPESMRPATPLRAASSSRDKRQPLQQSGTPR